MNDAAEVKTKKSDFFTYKGYPLVTKFTTAICTTLML